jgi:hypothetical protein
MITIKVTEQLESYCIDQVEKFNFGKRFTANGNKEQQLTGIIGQGVVMQLFGLELPDGRKGCDDGVDLVFENKTIDVKTMGRNTDVKPTYTNNFIKLQDYFKTEIYIFCSYNKIKKEVTICGWIDKDNFVSKRNLFEKGSKRTRLDGTELIIFTDTYEIDNEHLNNANSIEELKAQLTNFKKINMSKDLVRIQVTSPRESDKSIGVLVDLVFNENGLNTSASNLQWFPKSLCTIEKVEPIDRTKNLPTYFLTAPKWLVEKNLKK